MPSEQRLHPATLLFDVAKHVRAFAVPAVFVWFGASQSTGGPGGMFGRLPDGWEAWLLVLLLPAIVASTIRYLTFRLRYDPRELVIRSGLLFRNERHVPFAKIQNLDAVQNAFHRLLGVVEIRVQTGGGKDDEAQLSVLPHRRVRGDAPARLPGTGRCLRRFDINRSGRTPGRCRPGHSAAPARARVAPLWVSRKQGNDPDRRGLRRRLGIGAPRRLLESAVRRTDLRPRAGARPDRRFLRRTGGAVRGRRRRTRRAGGAAGVDPADLDGLGVPAAVRLQALAGSARICGSSSVY